MEDQKVLEAFVDDSIQEIKNLISKDLSEFRSMLLAVLKEKDRVSFEHLNTIMDAKLWQFRGENPKAWIVQAEHYFNFYKIEEDQKLIVVSHYLDGEALRWYQWLFRNNQLSNWLHFADKVRIQFKQKGYESAARRFLNLRQVFGESSDKHKDANSLCTSSKPIEFFITHNDLVSSVSKIENSCGDDVENEDKNDEEEIVNIGNKPIEFVIANANKPSLWINSIVSTTCDLSMFDICKALDDRWNQLFAYPFGLAQRWEEMSSIPYPFNYAKRMSKVTNDGQNWNYVGFFIILSLDIHPELVECDGCDLKYLGTQSNLVGKVVHQEFQGVSNAQNLTSWFYPACAKLEFEKGYCFYPTPCGILMASANAFLWTYVTFIWSQLEVAYLNVDTMMNHINQYISVLTKNEMEATLSLKFLSVCIDVFPITTYANVDENAIFDIALVKWLLIYSLQRID
ncbi:hypothetical protein KY289_026357 [Solanum tuberosum]|nr:hypothetical protein KY289_026357 [Solanum tuberosum]